MSLRVCFASAAALCRYPHNYGPCCTAGVEEESSLDGSLNRTSFHTPDALAAELTHLSRLDKRLSAVLERGAIKLLRADWLRRPGAQEEDPRILRRQDLELREARTGERIFLSPEEAASVLRAGRREIAALTYGWCAMDDPDPTGEYLAG